MDFEVLRQKLELPDEVRFPGDDRLAQRRPDALPALSAAEVQAVRDWYAADYEFVRLVEETLFDRTAPIEFDRKPADSV